MAKVIVVTAGLAVLLAGCPFAMQNDYFIAGDVVVPPDAAVETGEPQPPSEPPPTSHPDAAAPAMENDGGCIGECTGPDCNRMKPAGGCEDASCKGKDCRGA